MRISDFLTILFLGPLGIHKFKEGKTKLGLFYLCTMGFFFFGWVLDLAYALSLVLREGMLTE